MACTIGIPKETLPKETRVAMTPEIAKKLVAKKYRIIIESGAGEKAGFSDADFQSAGAEVVRSRAQVLGADLVWKIQRPSAEDVAALKQGGAIACLLDPFLQDDLFEKIASRRVSALCLELVPRTSRAQSMDVLSSQANIAGYRAVLEATRFYPRFFPMMMTSAGSAKAAKVVVLGAGVAGLQAIATARRLGAAVEAYDVRPEVKEQIQSLGAKFIEIDIGESGSGSGGYAKELSPEARKKLDAGLAERIRKADVVITTAAIPGRKAPLLVPESTVIGMRSGSVIVDMAASTGGNCELTVMDEVVSKHGVTIVGAGNWPALMPADSSAFFARNLMNLLAIHVREEKESGPTLQFNLEDDIIAAALVTHDGQIRARRK
ncbi:MAG: Re/Si-specific NAD(P)(+) transhydrogenase subunit alpha [Oligoflexia bacterium]